MAQHGSTSGAFNQLYQIQLAKKGSVQANIWNNIYNVLQWVSSYSRGFRPQNTIGNQKVSTFLSQVFHPIVTEGSPTWMCCQGNCITDNQQKIKEEMRSRDCKEFKISWTSTTNACCSYSDCFDQLVSVMEGNGRYIFFSTPNRSSEALLSKVTGVRPLSWLAENDAGHPKWTPPGRPAQSIMEPPSWLEAPFWLRHLQLCKEA